MVQHPTTCDPCTIEQSGYFMMWSSEHDNYTILAALSTLLRSSNTARYACKLSNVSVSEKYKMAAALTKS